MGFEMKKASLEPLGKVMGERLEYCCGWDESLGKGQS